jgi:signal transduction histidine kinase
MQATFMNLPDHILSYTTEPVTSRVILREQHTSAGSGVKRDHAFNTNEQIRHDLLNCLNALNLRLTLLERSQRTHEEHYRVIHECMTRLRTLIDQYTEQHAHPARPTAAQPVAFDLIELASQIIDSYLPLMQEKRHAVIFRTDANRLIVTGMRMQFERLIDNLLSNACKYTPENGRIVVDIYAQDALLNILVEDNGIGVSIDEQQTILERFYRSQTVQLLNLPGSGLGLSIVKDIVDELGGALKIQSQPGCGSAFMIQLPLR